MSEDAKHLELLSVFHYIVGALAALVSLIPIVHLFLGLGLGLGLFEDVDPAGRTAGCLLAAFAAGFILLGLTFAGCLIVAGRKLARRESYTFCLVMAGISCLFTPFGTVLGVFTILVLMRDSVKEMFGRPV